jgi:hypothetical protein
MANFFVSLFFLPSLSLIFSKHNSYKAFLFIIQNIPPNINSGMIDLTTAQIFFNLVAVLLKR